MDCLQPRVVLSETQSMTFPDLFLYRPLTDEELLSYEHDGFLKLGSLLTPEGLRRMREESMTAWSASKGPFDPDKTWLQNSLLQDIHHQSETIRRYYFHGPLLDVAEQLIAPNIKGATSQLTFKLQGNTKPFGWHQDNGYGELDPYNALSALTALDDADTSNGCLWIIPGSHREGQIEVRSKMTPEQKKAGAEVVLEADEAKAIPVPLKAGEALVFHCQTLHKSDGNFSKNRDRRILFLRYADADAVEVYNDRTPRLGKLLRGQTRFPAVAQFEADLE